MLQPNKPNATHVVKEENESTKKKSNYKTTAKDNYTVENKYRNFRNDHHGMERRA